MSADNTGSIDLTLSHSHPPSLAKMPNLKHSCLVYEAKMQSCTNALTKYEEDHIKEINYSIYAWNK